MEYYRYNPEGFSDTFCARLHQLNNLIQEINKKVKKIKENHRRLQTITARNEQLNLLFEVTSLERDIEILHQEMVSNGLLDGIEMFRDELDRISNSYDPREAIRRARHQESVEKACWKPWNIIYDKVLEFGGDVHGFSGDNIGSFIIPPSHRQRFIDFIDAIPYFSLEGISQTNANSFIIKYHSVGRFY